MNYPTLNTYLGEEIVKESPYSEFKEKDFALLYIEMYGQIDGAHHKQWLIDQVARILKGTPVVVKLATWENGQFEYRFDLEEPSAEYLQWVKSMKNGEDGEDTYDYYFGIAP